MGSPADQRAATLWAITCYFNPIGYQRRLANYRTFRRNLTVPLVTVELSNGGDFQLSAADADVLIQLRCPDILWHKERLLNIALRAVPRACHRVAWLDCDVVFTTTDWAERTVEALEHFDLLQLYMHFYDIGRDASTDEFGIAHCSNTGYSLAYGLATGAVSLEVLGGELRLQGCSQGLAWAAPRDVLDRHGFYDACIMGSGDRAMVCAALGEFDYARHRLQMNARWAEHYLAWAKPYFDTVGGRMGFVDGGIIHLWHGDLAARKYAERHKGLSQFDFDPFADLRLDDQGCWRWSSDKRPMHQFAKNYFASRKEDGEP
jgi:hypothetical protein